MEVPKEWFDVWWDPAELLSVYREHSARIPSDEFFQRPDLQPLRETGATALFAHIRNASTPCAVRLLSVQFPDFEICTKEKVEPFELTEADRPSRRRGNEYKIARLNSAAALNQNADDFDCEMFNPDEEERDALPAIALAIKRKADKHYSTKPNLLVYVNFFLFERHSFINSYLFKGNPLTKLQAEEVTHQCRDNFLSIWLLWGTNAVRCWPKPAVIRAPCPPPA